MTGLLVNILVTSPGELVASQMELCHCKQTSDSLNDKCSRHGSDPPEVRGTAERLDSSQPSPVSDRPTRIQTAHHHPANVHTKTEVTNHRTVEKVINH